MSDILLPFDFVEIGTEDKHFAAYASWSVIRPYFESRKLQAHFLDTYRSIVVTFGTSRMKAAFQPNEVVVEKGESRVPLLHEVVQNDLIHFANVPPELEAFVFGSHQLGGDGFDGYCDKIITPKLPPPDRAFWRLLAVVERA